MTVLFELRYFFSGGLLFWWPTQGPTLASHRSQGDSIFLHFSKFLLKSMKKYEEVRKVNTGFS